MTLMRRLMLTFYLTTSSLHALRVTNQPLSRKAASITRKMSSQGVGLSDIGGCDDGIVVPPFDNTHLSSWKQLIDVSIAKSRKIRGSNFVQIATVDEATMEPRCRTVVFRGFQNLPSEHPLAREMGDGASCVMKMITDNRSNKVRESTACEMVWWFSKSSEQYRIRGKLAFVGAGEDKILTSTRKEQWGNLSDPAREQFYWQSSGIDFSGVSIVPAGGRDEEGVLLPPPDSFLLMFLLPHQVDYLRLGDNYRQVDQLKDGSWTSTRVNP
jgi:pyridoxamine 5'-phosphate oxidase